MRLFKKSPILILVVMLWLGPAGVAQADPPPGRGKLGETLNFGQALTGSFQTQGGQDSNDDGETGEDEGRKRHPVLLSLAEHFAGNGQADNVDLIYNDMEQLHAQGYGVGNIAKAYFLASRLETKNLSPTEILSRSRDDGWGNYLKSQGVHPGSVRGVGAVRSAKNGTFVPPGQAKKLDGTFLPPGQAKKLDGTFLPPGQAKKLDGTFLPPGQAKKLDGTFLPPGQAKKLDDTALPAGQAKKQNGTFVPPGQAKKLNGQEKGTE